MVAMPCFSAATGDPSEAGSPCQSTSPLVDGVRAGENLDQRGLSGAVLSQQAVHLAGPDPQVHPVECAHARENLDDPAHFEQRHRGVVFLDLGHGVTVVIVSYVGQAKVVNRD